MEEIEIRKSSLSPQDTETHNLVKDISYDDLMKRIKQARVDEVIVKDAMIISEETKIGLRLSAEDFFQTRIFRKTY